MANTLILNQNYVFDGLGTLTFTVPADGIYSVQCQTTVPQAVATGDGAGSQTGLGSGRGGGGNVAGFAQGGLGLGNGSVGQGFGATSGYQQPPAAGSNETTGPEVSSVLSIVVKQGSTTRFTAPTIGEFQSAQQFRFAYPYSANDVVTVVFASTGAPDKALNSIQSNVSIAQGL